MVSNEDNWIRIFDIPDISKHKKGFTIYKVISMLYPRNCPDSVTKVTVWKRYNDFKKLHRDIKSHCKILKIKDKFPNLPSTSYFRRFDEEVIQQRRANVLKFLEFIATHPQLFSLDVCVRFFKTSYTPCELLKSNINNIRAELNLPIDPDYDLLRPNSDDDHTISDTDSVSTLSSTMDHLPDPLNSSNANSSKTTKKFDPLNSCASSLHDSLSISAANISLDGSVVFEGQAFPTPPETPNSMSSTSLSNYILEASHFITQAVECEVAKKYEEAFSAYKAGIDVLLKNVKDDRDFERKEMIRRKIEKYLLRAEKIYNLHLSPESKTILTYVVEGEGQGKESIQPTASDLYKYKVVKVIASGMLVLHSDSQQLFYIKVIYKTSKFSSDKLILPTNVPYMVKMYNYYNCENALFLVLQYCSGTRLSDYIKQKQINSDDILNASFCSYTTSVNLSPNKEDEYSDYDSDHSYSDLILDYTTSRLARSNSTIKTSDSQSDVKNENLAEDQPDVVDDSESSNELKSDQPEISDIVAKSQELISSVDETLHKNINIQTASSVLKSTESEKVEMQNNKSTKSSRKSSERSDWSLFDDFQFTENTLLPVQDVIKWAAQLLLSLEKLHLLGVTCCDLQIKNLLIDEYGDLVLTYMCNVTEKYDIAFINANDLTLAPEMYSFHPITEVVDWWSYGAILYEMLVGMPLRTVHPEGLTGYTILKIPKYVTMEGRSLLKQLLAYEPHERLGYSVNGAEDIKSHPFFNSIVWNELAAKYKNP